MMIPLTRGQYAVVDDDDLPLLSEFRWYAEATPRQGTTCWYAATKPNRRKIFMHRLIMDAPVGVEVDHIDGDGLNNQRANLRFATRSQNNCNRTRYNSALGRNIYRDYDRYEVKVKLHGVTTRLSFTTLEEAQAARDLLVRALHGEFAR